MKIIIFLFLLYNCSSSLAMKIENKEDVSFINFPSDKKILFRYKMHHFEMFSNEIDESNAVFLQNSTIKYKSFVFKNSLEERIFFSENFKNYSIIEKSLKKNENFDYLIDIDITYKPSFSRYAILALIGIIPIKFYETNYTVNLEVKDDKNKIIYQKKYENIFSFYLAMYTFIYLNDYNSIPIEFYNYQINQILSDLQKQNLIQ